LKLAAQEEKALHTLSSNRVIGAVLAAASLVVISQGARAGVDTQLQLYDGTTYTVGGYYDPNHSSDNIAAGSASALGFADLSSGVLRAEATSAVGANASALATAIMRDDVTFSSNATGIGYLDFHWDGTLSSLASPSYGGALLSFGYLTVGIEGSVGAGEYTDALYNADVNQTCNGLGGFEYCSYGASIDQTGYLMFNLQPGVNTIQVDLVTSTLNGVTGDFSHTANIDLRLPPGVTYTSASGDFLSTATPIVSPVSPVPEPGTYLLMLAGFGSIFGVTRRIRSQQA